MTDIEEMEVEVPKKTGIYQSFVAATKANQRVRFDSLETAYKVRQKGIADGLVASSDMRVPEWLAALAAATKSKTISFVAKVMKFPSGAASESRPTRANDGRGYFTFYFKGSFNEKPVGAASLLPDFKLELGQPVQVTVAQRTDRNGDTVWGFSVAPAKVEEESDENDLDIPF